MNTTSRIRTVNGMRYKGIVFDKDGTLLDFERCWLPVARHALMTLLDELELPSELLPDLLAAGGIHGETYDIDGVFCYGTGAMMIDVIIRWLEAHGVKDDRNKLAGLIMRITDASYVYGEMKPDCENIVGVFECLRGMGLRIALATSDNRAGAMKCLETFGIARFFDEIYCDDGVHSKPDPYFMRVFCGKYVFDACDVVMVGDTPSDASFAKNSGAAMVAVAKNEHNTAILAPVSDAVIHDISQIFTFLD